MRPGVGCYAGRMPTTPSAARRLAALRLALHLTAGTLSSLSFSWGHQPFGDAHSAMEWLRAQLSALARQDSLIRELLHVLNPEHAPRPWDSPRGAKREMLRLAARVRTFTDG